MNLKQKIINFFKRKKEEEQPPKDKPYCPVCKAYPLDIYELPNEPYTYVVCAKCGSLLNYTPFGMKIRVKYKYKKEVEEWNNKKELKK